MGFGSVWHWLIVLLVVLVLFGRGRVSEIMGDFGKGIKSFKQGLSEDPVTPPAPPAQIPPAQISGADAASTPSATETTNTGQK